MNAPKKATGPLLSSGPGPEVGQGRIFKDYPHHSRFLAHCQPGQNLPTDGQLNTAALALLDQAETFMARAEQRGDSTSWVNHCLIWFELHALAFCYGPWAREASDVQR